MPDFSRIIRMAYNRILDREPDPGGLAHYNERMNEGTSEATIREALLRSPEYAAKNPDGTGAVAAGARRPAAGRRAAAARKKRTPRKVR
jgi:hypothetical protein